MLRWLTYILLFLPVTAKGQWSTLQGKISLEGDSTFVGYIQLSNSDTFYEVYLSEERYFKIPNIKPGTYDIIVCPEYSWETRQIKPDIVFLEGKTVEANIVAKFDYGPVRSIKYFYKDLTIPIIITSQDSDYGEISGRITDGFGEPIRKAKIRVYRNNNLRTIVQTDSLGNYNVYLEEGVYDLKISKQYGQKGKSRQYKIGGYTGTDFYQYNYPAYRILSIPVKSTRKIELNYVLPLRRYPLPKKYEPLEVT